MSTIADLIWPEDILLDVDVLTKSELFERIGRHMEREHAMSAESVILGLSRREDAGSTGLGEGVAIPHSRVKNLDRVQLAYVRLTSPIPFGAPDDMPVSDVLVILVPKQASEEHLVILAETAQLFSDSHFRHRMRSCGCPQEVKRLLEAWSFTVDQPEVKKA